MCRPTSCCPPSLGEEPFPLESGSHAHTLKAKGRQEGRGTQKTAVRSWKIYLPLLGRGDVSIHGYADWVPFGSPTFFPRPQGTGGRSDMAKVHRVNKMALCRDGGLGVVHAGHLAFQLG